MALATRCPHCQTTFRVAHDQLKLRAGLVRCGACKEIFNGVEHLLRPEETQQALASARPGPSPPQAGTGASAPQVKAFSSSPQTPSGPGSPQPPVDVPRTEEHEADNHTGLAADRENTVEPSMPAEKRVSSNEEIRMPPSDAAPADSNFVDPLQRMTLMDFTAFDTHDSKEESCDGASAEHISGTAKDLARNERAPNAEDEISLAIEDLQNKPWRRGATDSAGKRGQTEPSFMAHARRQKRYGKAMRIIMGAGSVFLFIAVLMQSAFVFRDAIAARLPQYRPVLTSLCAQLGCQVKLPAQIDKVSIESSELQSLPSLPNTFTLAALLRNQATTDQAWPYLELTLNDTNEKPVARKVFQPSDYLSSSQIECAGFPAQSEQQVKISFEMLQMKAAGYRLYLFYP